MATPSDPREKEKNGSGPLAIVEDATCVACGCLCDDIELTVSEGRIVEARNACPIGRAWFLADRGLGTRPPATIEGRPADPEEALDRAAGILAGARAPVVLGLTATSVEAQAAAVALADRIGAVIDPSHAAEALPRLLATARVGRVSASLGEVKNRADVVVFWGVDPVTTHPRHWERYSVEPRGRFVPDGRSGRVVLVADAARTSTAERADHVLTFAADRQLETLQAIRSLVLGLELDPGAVAASTGLDLEALRSWAGWLARARYGAFFFGTGLGGTSSVEAALLLVRDLNAKARFVALTMGGPGNPAGAEAALAWQAGYPVGVDFAPGYPRSLPGETSAASRLERGEADAALIVAEDPEPGLTEKARRRLREISRIVVAPDATARDATVALASATYGIHAGGTVVRSDGVMLPLRPALGSRLPSEREWLERIRTRLEALAR
jgi:formylmethanofuran dehydrogenase subunit B